MRFAVLLGILCGFFCETKAQWDFHYTNYTANNELPTNTIYAIFKDKEGFLWFGTDKGVIKYDGYVFKHIEQAAETEGNEILEIAELPNKEMLFFSLGAGILSYTTAAGKIIPHPQNEKIKAISKTSWVKSHSIDKEGNLWVSLLNRDLQSYKDTFFYKITNDSVLTYPPQKENIIHNEYYKKLDSGGIIWAGPSRRVTEKNKENINRILKLNDGRLLVCSHTQLWFIDKQGLIKEILAPVDKGILKLYEDKQGLIWVGSHKGVWVLDKEGKLKTQLLAEKSVCDIEQDNEGQYWLATLSDGIFLVRSLAVKVNREIKSHDFIMLKDQVYSRYDQTIAGINNQSKYLFPRFILDSLVGYFSKELLDSLGVPKNIYKDDKRALLWVARSKGALALDTEGRIVYNSKLLGFDQWTNSILAQNDTVWLGNSKGLWCWYLKKNKIEAFFLNEKINVQKIAPIGKDTLCVATKGQGLWIIPIKNVQKAIKFDDKNGMLSNYIESLHIIKNKTKIWCGTNKGLCLVDIKKQSIYCYDCRNMLLSNELKSIVEISSDSLLIGSTAGLSLVTAPIFTLNIDKNTKAAIPLFLVAAHNNSKKIETTDSIQYWDYDQHQLVIHFLGLSYKEHPLYRYRLRGATEKWEQSTETSVRYSNLAPGYYEFEVAARYVNGEWGAEKTLLRFHIYPHFSQTTWFRAIVFLLLSAVAVAIGLGIAYLLNRRTRTQLFIKSLEQKALRSQMNPHFIFNTMNSVSFLVASNQKKEAQRYIAKLSKLMRCVLENSKHNLITLDKEIEVLLLYIELEKLRYGEHVLFHFEHPPLHDSIRYKIPPMLIQPIIENALVHGLSHKTDNGNLWCSIRVENNSVLRVQVDDDGIGREKSKAINATLNQLQKKESVGLRNIQERIDNLNKMLKNTLSITIQDLYETTEETGTSVVLTIGQMA